MSGSVLTLHFVNYSWRPESPVTAKSSRSLTVYLGANGTHPWPSSISHWTGSTDQSRVGCGPNPPHSLTRTNFTQQGKEQSARASFLSLLFWRARLATTLLVSGFYSLLRLPWLGWLQWLASKGYTSPNTLPSCSSFRLHPFEFYVHAFSSYILY